jgi:mannose/fructose/N-acetylgalactosamine-specific phosphotransferase system component IIC
MNKPQNWIGNILRVVGIIMTLIGLGFILRVISTPFSQFGMLGFMYMAIPTVGGIVVYAVGVILNNSEASKSMLIEIYYKMNKDSK